MFFFLRKNKSFGEVSRVIASKSDTSKVKLINLQLPRETIISCQTKPQENPINVAYLEQVSISKYGAEREDPFHLSIFQMWICYAAGYNWKNIMEKLIKIHYDSRGSSRWGNAIKLCMRGKVIYKM